MKSELHCGDNLGVMRNMMDESVDLIYADPPFFTQKDWGQFDDRFCGMGNYMKFMKDRVIEMRRLLKPTGSIYVHLDWHAVHYVKVMMDGIFKDGVFQNEIIWGYEGGGRSKTKNFARKHDNILCYSKGNDSTFNMDDVLLPHTEAQLTRYNIIKDGKRFANMKGKIRPLGDGKIPSDVWSDISPLSCNAVERLGYPTQKPEALLDRIIKASSNVGDVVLDPFCGSGTACVVANKLLRHYIGIDENQNAIDITRERLI